MTMPAIDGADAATAAHESGHATIARAIGLDVRRASASSDDPGVITRWRVGIPPAEYASTVKKLLLVDLSGPLAECRATGRSELGAARTDRRNAISRALRLVLDEHGLADAQLTDALRSEAAELVERLRPKAAALVEENWPAIERVAAALADGRTLTGDEVDALMAEEKP